MRYDLPAARPSTRASIAPLGLCLLLSASCKDGKDPAGTDSADTASPGLDVSERLGPGEVRAGVVRAEAALFGGASAEGQLGDYKLYNDRVQLIVQAPRPGSYYEDAGGGIIDVDLVRPEGEPGRDVVDELMVMVGLGRICEADSVEVLADGSDGEAAVLRVTGHLAPMTLITGTLESDSVVPEREGTVVTDITLTPDSHLVLLETTVTWQDQETAVQLGDFGMLAFDVASSWHPGRGLDGDGDADGSWLGVVGFGNEVSVALMSRDEPFPRSAIQDILSEVGPVLSGFGSSVTLAEGDTLSTTRYLGVGPDPATLSAEWNAVRGVGTTSVGGTVLTEAGDPVAGARVTLLDDAGLPETLAFTDAAGAWTAEVTAGSPVAVATGRGEARFLDLPAGAGWLGPYAASEPAALALASMESGASGAPFAEGYGVGEALEASVATTHTLTAPGQITVDTGDGLPFVLEVAFASGDPVSADPALVPGRPSGRAALGWSRDGSVTVAVEPGDYELLVHRGLTWETWSGSVSVASGEEITASASLEQAYAPEGAVVFDPHSHAAPSGDGGIPMSHRLIVHAANGVQVHVGTDHDHIADYRPLLAPLGLEGVLASVVGNEVSPVLRGHMNVYPLEPQRELPNNGAVAWWEGVEDTESLVAEMWEMGGGAGVVQLNHPLDSGVLEAANYDLDAGVIGTPDRYTEAFTAIEVLNDGHYADYLPFFLDLVNRGQVVTPVGVSDAHGYGGVGQSVTWLAVGHSDPAALTDAEVTAAMDARATVVSRGPYVELTAEGAWAPGQTLEGPVTVKLAVFAPSWMDVDAVDVLRDGEVVDTLEVSGTEGGERLRVEVLLEPEVDASYTFVARGDAALSPVSPGDTAWAITSPVFVDVDGGGWESPLPPLQLGN